MSVLSVLTVKMRGEHRHRYWDHRASDNDWRFLVKLLEEESIYKMTD